MDARLERVALRVTGVVQGVGYRPFAYARATELGITGFIGNDSAGVFVEAQGSPEALARLIEALRDGPPLAEVEDVQVSPLSPVTESGFAIVDSVTALGATTIPPDTATCAECLADIADPANRRHRYPFTACTHCGPRYTMVTGLPYDRPFTTMATFPMCDECQGEYDDPLDRRFHAQPTACPACGPRLRWAADGTGVGDDAALAAALDALQAGRIVAIKGIGGYHLACDALQPEAVHLLRERKQRGTKPFAVMARDLDTARMLVEVDDTVAQALTSREAPIVLADALDLRLRDCVAPGQARLGVMLPYSPLHHLLFTAHPARRGEWVPEVLVMTSGNLSDEPISIDAEEAASRLAGLADGFLHHDRPIHVSCDDSVISSDGQPVRRSRGYAPLPLRLPLDVPPLLAVGGELKTTLCVARGARAWMSQHIGDTANLETLALLARTADTLGELVGVNPELVIADLHPNYLSRRWAERHAIEAGADLRLVQHHHAHVASLMAEHGIAPGEPILGFAFDGTGMGTDGTIWGGEILLATYAEAERVGHLAPIALPGGDAAVRRPARTALAHLHAAQVEWSDDLPPVSACDETELKVVGRMLETGTGCVPTTSMGRLFDAVSSLLGVCQDADYEGQAAIELEAVSAAGSGDWHFHLIEGRPLIVDPAPVVRAAVAGLQGGLPPAQAAYAFHEALAGAVADSAAVLAQQTGVRTIGLTGGVFANRLLTGLCQERLGGLGMTVLTHRQVPPNDGGLALGQVVVAAAAN